MVLFSMVDVIFLCCFCSPQSQLAYPVCSAVAMVKPPLALTPRTSSESPVTIVALHGSGMEAHNPSWTNVYKRQDRAWVSLRLRIGYLNVIGHHSWLNLMNRIVDSLRVRFAGASTNRSNTVVYTAFLGRVREVKGNHNMC